MRNVGYLVGGDIPQLPTGIVTAEEADSAARALYRSLVRQPRHAAAMHTLQLQHPKFEPTVHLALQWFMGHCFSGHVHLFSIAVFVSVHKSIRLLIPCIGLFGYLRAVFVHTGTFLSRPLNLLWPNFSSTRVLL